MKITIPIPQKISLNKFYSTNLHWSKRNEIAGIYHNALLPYRKERITQFPAIISYFFYFKSRPLDSSNCFGMVKMLEDGMVRQGILPDDSPKYVLGSLVFSQKGKEDIVFIEAP